MEGEEKKRHARLHRRPPPCRPTSSVAFISGKASSGEASRTWTGGSADRVTALHSKARKGCARDRASATTLVLASWTPPGASVPFDSILRAAVHHCCYR